ncbi:MAG: methylated-DNA--[protein]-cysteine S-methyltransferase [Gammaproteobacteria bacterium]|nr:methylated-DNA--[protein]-cysteine S-methyltransferase [Gammaproteobacteria bacterium]
MNFQYFDSPLGKLRLVSNDGQIVQLEFAGQHSTTTGERERSDAVLTKCQHQLDQYFSGKRKAFDLPIAAQGTAFQRLVWRALQRIPYGETRSYADIARNIMKPTAMRAVGAANGRNPVPVIVPCHRVIGSNGSLTGFAGGINAKKTLLQLEGVL